MDMALASVDFWDIVDGSEKAPPSNMESKVLKEYQRRVKKAMSIIVLNLADNQLAHVKSCKRPTEAWNILCNILFVRHKFFTCKMDEGDNLLDHVNKVKTLADQLACLEGPLRAEDIVMTLLFEFAGIIQILDHRFGNDADEIIEEGVCDGTFDA